MQSSVNSKFAFVILHYGSSDVTMSAVHSVMSLEKANDEVSIVVVDNASPGGTGDVVHDRLKSLQHCYFLSSKENLGFARGNNLGFAFAKNELKADFVVLMNNDAVIESPNFCELVAEDFAKERFAVLGPCIHTPNGKSQNPLRRKLLKGFRLKLTQIYLWLDLLLTWLFFAPLVSKFCTRKKKADSLKDGVSMNDVELHGSFLIFSPLYIQRFDGLDERTFMYCEEEFLFARCVANGLKSRYNPAISVFHNEVDNLSANVGTLRKKSLFRIKNCLKSLRIYEKSGIV